MNVNRTVKRVRNRLLKLVSRKMSLQMFIILILVVAIPLLALGLALLKTSQKAIKSSVLRGHQELAVRAASEVGLFIQQPKDLLISNVSILSMVFDHAWKQESILVELALNSPIFSRISSIGQDGIEIATSELGSELVDRSQEAGFTQALSGITYLSDVYLDTNHAPSMNLAIPIKSLGEVIGVVLAQINLRGMWDIVDGIKLGETGMAYIISDRSILVAHPDKKKILANDNLVSDQIIKTILSGHSGNIEYLDQNNIAQVSAYAPVLGLDWILVVNQAAEEAYSFSWTMRTQSWLFIILSELIAVVVSIFIARALVKPIRSLAVSAKLAAQGKLDKNISFNRKDELGDVVRSFNDLIKKLNKAEASERLSAVGKAVATVVHELRNSLIMVNTYVDIFPERHKEKEYIEGFTKTMPGELERVRGMLQELSDFSRGSKSGLVLSDIDPHDLIGECQSLTKEKLIQKNIELELVLDQHLPMIPGNQDKLKQVFINLITNAIDAIESGGKITISASLVSSRTDAQQKLIEIKVKDTGPGIEYDSLDKIFEPFHTTKSDGLGLGLAICRGIIEQHKGTIMVVNEADQGACFTIRLPVKSS